MHWEGMLFEISKRLLCKVLSKLFIFYEIFLSTFDLKVERSRVYVAKRSAFSLDSSLDFLLFRELLSMLLHAKHRAINYGSTIFVFVDFLVVFALTLVLLASIFCATSIYKYFPAKEDATAAWLQSTHFHLASFDSSRLTRQGGHTARFSIRFFV